MSKTKISYATDVWNVVTGCTPVSAGCKNCWAKRMSKRLAGRCGYPPMPNQFKVTLHPERLEEPLHWKKPRRIFVASMGDLFHADIPFDFILRVWITMAKTPQHTYLIFTKRPDRMFRFVKEWLPGAFTLATMVNYLDRGLVLPNVWLLTSVEDQPTADERIPWLLKCPAVVRGLSCEPLLSHLDLLQYLKGDNYEQSIERASVAQVSRNGGMEDRRTGKDMESKGSASRTQTSPGISSGGEDDKWNQSIYGSAQISLSALQREYSGRDNNQSQERYQGRQQAREFGTGDLFGANVALNKDFEKPSMVIKPVGREECGDEVNQFSGGGNSRDIFKGEYISRETREDVRCSISNNIENSARGKSQETSRTNSQLYSKKETQQPQPERERPISLCIVGAESGPGARDVPTDAFRNLRDQCIAAGIKFYLKQMMIDGKLVKMPALDGQIWDEMP